MHILLIHQAFAALNEPGGTRHHELALLLAQAGHQVTVVASPVSYLTGTRAELGEETQGGVRVIRSYTYAALHKSFVHRVFAFFSFMVSSFWAGLRVRDVDMVWGTSPPIFQGVTAWALSAWKRVPLLMEVRDLWPAFAVQMGVLTNPVLIRLSEWLERFLLGRATQVMVNSPGFLPHVQAKGAQNVALVPNGTDVRMFYPEDDGATFRRENGLEGKFVVMYAGAHGMANDLGVVIRAAEQLRDRSDIALVLIGDGKEKTNLIEQARALSLNNVHFIPPVPKSDMGRALAGADACLGILMPVPLYATVYPNKIFDYMAAGRPTILMMEGVIREVIEAAEGGIYVPCGDADALAQTIRSLANQPESCQRMGKFARAYVETHFDRVTLGQKLVALVESLKQK